MDNLVLMCIKWEKDGEPTPENFFQEYGVKGECFDNDFGFVKVDDEKNLFAFKVEEAQLKKIVGKLNIFGPFSDSKIEPF